MSKQKQAKLAKKVLDQMIQQFGAKAWYAMSADQQRPHVALATVRALVK